MDTIKATAESAEGSDCLAGQAGIGCHRRLSRRIALRMMISLRATATRATSFGFPAATSFDAFLKRFSSQGGKNGNRATGIGAIS